ncbi:hypothetical protein BGZ72_001519 [Mortierella alpina]|nr:hypothetical protein BGZ72_001519 [Mortierella alpina]
MALESPFICQEIFTVPLALEFGDEDPSESSMGATNTTASNGPSCVRFATLPQCEKIGKEKKLYFHCVEQGTISIGSSGPKPLPEPEDFPMNAYLCNVENCPTQSPDDVPSATTEGGGHEHKNGGSTSNSNTGSGSASSAQKATSYSTKKTLVGVLVFAMLLPQILAA